jgi:hypothetical protein
VIYKQPIATQEEIMIAALYLSSYSYYAAAVVVLVALAAVALAVTTAAVLFSSSLSSAAAVMVDPASSKKYSIKQAQNFPKERKSCGYRSFSYYLLIYMLFFSWILCFFCLLSLS